MKIGKFRDACIQIIKTLDASYQYLKPFFFKSKGPCKLQQYMLKKKAKDSLKFPEIESYLTRFGGEEAKRVIIILRDGFPCFPEPFH